LDYLEELDPSTRAIVRNSYSTAIQATFWFSTVLAGFTWIAAMFIIEKPLPSKK